MACLKVEGYEETQVDNWFPPHHCHTRHCVQLHMYSPESSCKIRSFSSNVLAFLGQKMTREQYSLTLAAVIPLNIFVISGS